MAEETLGFAKLLLSADSTELKKGIDQAKEHARSMGKTMGEVADEVGGKGRKLLMAQERVDRAVISMTGTVTQQKIAALEQRYSAEMAAARRAGSDTLALEQAFATKKRQLLLESVSEEVKGSNVLIDAKKRVGLATVAMGDKAQSAGEKMKGLRGAMGLVGLEGTKFGQALSLASSGFTPLTAGLGVATGLLMAYTERIKAAERDTRSFLDLAAEGRSRHLKMENAMAVEGGTLKDARLADLQVDYDRQLRKVEELARRAEEMKGRTFNRIGEHMAGADGGIPVITDLALMAGDYLTGPAQAALREWEVEKEKLGQIIGDIESLKKRESGAARVSESSDFGAWSDMEFARMKKYREEQAANAAQATTATKETAVGLQDAGKASESFAEVSSASMEEAGEASETFADVTVAALDRVTMKTVEASRNFGTLRREFTGGRSVEEGIVTLKEGRAVAKGLYASGMTQAAIREELSRRGLDPGLLGRGGGNMARVAPPNFISSAAQLEALARPFSGAFVLPGRSPVGTYGPGVNPQAPTSMQAVKITIEHQVKGRHGQLAADILAAAEEDIRRGGSLSRVIEEYFDTPRIAR